MTERFGDMLNSQLQNNPEAWRHWQAEKRGQKIKMSRKKIAQLVENAIQQYREYNPKDKCMSQVMRNIEDLNWAREKQISLEIDYAWEYYRDSLFFQELFHELGWTIQPIMTPLLLEEPLEHRRARESYMDYMSLIHARVDASTGGFSTLISDDQKDDSPYLGVPKK